MGKAESGVRYEPWDVDSRLAELGEGLTRAVLVDTVQRAHAAFAACTPHHPRNFGAISRWGNGIAAIRDHLVPVGWESADRNGQPLVLNPSGDLAITITGADQNTGRNSESQPRTTSKGPVTIEAVEQNAYLFPNMEAEAKAKAQAEETIARNTWFLLIHLDRLIGQVRSELSHPTKLDEERRIIEWSERILLPPLDIDATLSNVVSDEGPDDGDISIEIKRRA